MTAIEVQTPRGKNVVMHYREGTTDLSTIGGTLYLWGKTDDEYGFSSEYPKTYLDIGGHIGITAVAVLADNPDCRAVILEPLPENIPMIEQNLAENGLSDRATLVHGAIGTGSEQKIGYRLARVPDADPAHEYVGAPMPDDYEGHSFVAPVYPLGDLIDLLGDTVDLGKIDCEGCEWVALRSPDAKRVGTWVGEYHGEGDLDLDGFDVKVMPHGQGGTGNFRAVAR